NGRETQLTHDGMPGFAYATNNSGRQRSARPCVLWSPDSKRIASFQQDERGVGDMYLVRAQRGHPTLETWKYPMPCDATIPTIHRVIIDVEALRVVRLDMPADYVRSASWLGVASDQTGELEAQWSPDGASLAFVSVSRDHKRAQLRIADALTGAVRDVLEEHASTFYEAAISAWHASRATRHPNWVCLLGSEEVIWYSARSNWSHLYLYELATGKLKRAITSGNWNVVTLLHVDQQARMIYFLAVGRESGRNPYFEHLYRVGLDGGEPVLLTDEDATHAVSMAPSGEYFVDSFSRPEMPPVAVLRDRTGRLLRTLERADISRLTSIGWKPPATITVKARDQRTNLFGLMFKPSHLDENRKYPIVNAIYSGSILGSVISWGHTARRWGAFAPAHGLTGDAQSLAELGFIVVMIDGMGTPLRSRAFHEAAYGNYGDGSLADQVTGMQQLAQRYPFIDIDRAGIYGLSGGGYRAARGMLTYPDFFNVGVAIAGNHDPMSYQDEYAEKFIGLCSQGPGGSSNYDMQANMALARNLTGRLLLAHGMMDDNVPPYHTLLLAEALIEANKDFDLLLLPSQGHAIAAGEQGRYLLRRCWDHFVRHLLGAEPPREYRMSAPSGANTTRYQRSAFGDVGLVRVRS
ncbi:MAG TPA: DPP IV N-terminal domain-containing protein, partial [Steroidobacteraceae bacterium]|nr:DPP IV N-terminal domain-containing protein [Steroidobacteraceae bacterium]